MLGGGTEAGGFVESRQGVDLGNLLVILPAPPAEEIDGGIAGGGEEEGPGVSHATAGVGAEGSDISFLHEIVVVGQSGKAFREIGAQGRFVGLNLLGKPLGLISRGHGVKLTGNGELLAGRFEGGRRLSSAMWRFGGGENFFQKRLTHLKVWCVE